MSFFDDYRRIGAQARNLMPVNAQQETMTSLICILSLLTVEEVQELVYCINVWRHICDGNDDDEGAEDLAYQITKSLSETLWSESGYWFAVLGKDLRPVSTIEGCR